MKPIWRLEDGEWGGIRGLELIRCLGTPFFELLTQCLNQCRVLEVVLTCRTKDIWIQAVTDFGPKLPQLDDVNNASHASPRLSG